MTRIDGGGRNQLLGLRSQSQPDGEPEGGTASDRALDADAAAHQFSELFGDGQPQAGPAISASCRGIHLREALEEPVHPVGRNADAGVGDGESHGRRVPCDCSSSVSRMLMEPDSVNLIALLTRLIRICLTRWGSPLTCLGTSGMVRQARSSPSATALIRHHFRDVFDSRVQVKINRFDLQLPGFDLREIEEVVDQFGQ